MAGRDRKDEAVTVGPFIGMNDSVSLAAQDSQRASYLENVYAPNAANGGDLISRLGYTRLALTGVTRTGTIDSKAIIAGTSYTVGLGTAVTGTSTLFSTELAVGDVITANGQSMYVRAINSNTSIDALAQTTGTISGAYTVAYGGISGPIYAVFRALYTDGTIQRLMLAKVSTPAAAVINYFAGTGGIAVGLLLYDPTNTTHPVSYKTSATMNGTSLAVDQRIYTESFANYWIYADGTNRMRKTTSAYVQSTLTDSSHNVKGAPKVYYGKLFIIDAADNATLRWSEENDPDTGYGTGTSDNSWTLRQTSSDPLECLAATNDALYCFRPSSTAIITGAANSDFRSSGTMDAIQSVGCRSPDSIVLYGSSVVFLNQYGQPYRITPGYGPEPLHLRVQETLRGAGATAAQLRAAWGRYDPVSHLIKFGYRATAAATTNDQMVVFEPSKWECLGLHKWYSSGTTVMDHAVSTVWEDENGYMRHVVGSGSASDIALYIQKADTSLTNAAQDTVAAGAATIPVTIETPKIGNDVRIERSFGRLTVGTRNVGGTTAGITKWKSQYKGPYSTAYTSAEAMYLGPATTVPSTMTLDGACVKAEQPGVSCIGRWIQVKLTNDTTSNPATRATCDQVTVDAVAADSDYTRR